MNHRTPICDDKVWVAPRLAALRLLNTYNTLLSCDVQCSPQSSCWSQRGSCCNRNEYVLAYSGYPLSERANVRNALKSIVSIVRTEQDLIRYAQHRETSSRT